jgi:hypothetical protein
MSMTMRTAALALLLALPPLAACGGEAADAHAVTPPRAVEAAPAPGTHVDSILPPGEEERRFREGLAEPRGLAGGEETREALVRAFVRAVERADTAAVRGMILSRAEFAWLYYPSTEFTRAPKRMSPALLWFLTMQESEKGIGRLLARRGGRRLAYVASRCAPEPRVEGANRLWDRCTVTVRAEGGTKTERLFGTIVERDGRFKFVSYQNEY